MITISLCMIVKNEEDVLQRCLEAVAPVVDEIVVVDTGSTDRTRDIALGFTDRLLHFDWIDDFSAARNFAFAAATQDYLLWLDADDILTPDNRTKLLALKSSLSGDVDSVSMIYELARDEYGNLAHSLRRNRLVKRSREFRWQGAVHEALIVSGTILTSEIAVVHSPLKDEEPGRNLRIYRRMELRGDTFSPRDVLYYAHELLDAGEHATAASLYERFLSDGQGWAEDEIIVCGKLADCYHALGDSEKEWEAICRSFRYGSPRADFCCRIGYRLLHEGKYEAAAHWYLTAANLPQEERWSSVNHACRTWLPHLQLCVCYDRLGKHELAYEHNEIARTYRPDDSTLLRNKAYLEAILPLNPPTPVQQMP